MDDEIEPFVLIVMPRAEREIQALATWLHDRDPEAAVRFREVLQQGLPSLCQKVAELLAMGTGLLRPDEDASLAFARPTFEEIVTATKSGKRARRSSANSYRVYFALSDDDGNDVPETLIVLFIRHAAARPVWDMDAEAAENGE